MDPYRLDSHSLDSEVARRILGWHQDRLGAWFDAEDYGTTYSDGANDYFEVWSPSTVLAHAWLLVEALHARGECLTLTWRETLDADEWGLRWLAEFRMTGALAIALNPALAISRAALIAIDRLAEVNQ